MVLLFCNRFDRVLLEFGSCPAKPIDLTQDSQSESIVKSEDNEEDSGQSSRFATILIINMNVHFCTLYIPRFYYGLGSITEQYHVPF